LTFVTQEVTLKPRWRVTFYFEGQDAYLVDYQDYH